LETRLRIGRKMALSNEELSKLWDAANKLRKSLDAGEYKHIVLGLVFLKYVSDSFEERYLELEASFSDPNSKDYKQSAKAREAALKDRDRYRQVNVFWVPEQSRWKLIQNNAKQATIAEQIDQALFDIEKENPKLHGIVERSYANAKLSPADLGAVVDLIGSISFSKERRANADILGQVYEYFLGRFAANEGKMAGQFYTTPSIVRTIVEILQPTSGRVYDPACGSGGMFVQSEKFVEAHGGKLGNISIYGQESNPTTRRLCAMNLAIRGIDFNLGKTHGDTFLENQFPDLRFDFIMMNPPFGKDADYPKDQLLNDSRWKKYGVPRERPANYAWMSHAVYHLAPKGRAGIVMPRGTLTSSQGGDDAIRKGFLDDDLIECIIDMPGQLFFNVTIPSCLWFFNKDKSKRKANRSGQVLFIDARKLGTPISKTQIEFSHEEIKRISQTFDNWCEGNYEDIDGFCRSVTREEIAKNNDSLSPGRYIGSEEVESESDEEFSIKMQSLIEKLSVDFSETQKLEIEITSKLKAMGYEI